VRTSTQDYGVSKVTVLLSESEFARLDAFCEEKGYKKSTLVARLIRDYLDSLQFPNQEELPLDSASRTSPRRARTRVGS
jgi:hypothetical protein